MPLNYMIFFIKANKQRGAYYNSVLTKKVKVYFNLNL